MFSKMCIFNPFPCYHPASNNHLLFPRVSPHCPNSFLCFPLGHPKQHRWSFKDVLVHVTLLVKFCISFQFIQMKAKVLNVFAVALKDRVGWASLTSLIFSFVSLLISPRSCQACFHLRVFAPAWRFHMLPFTHAAVLPFGSLDTITVRPSLTNHYKMINHPPDLYQHFLFPLLCLVIYSVWNDHII